MAPPWHIKLYRGYQTIVRSDRFITRRFLAEAARTSGAVKVDICLDVGAGNAPYRQAVLRYFAVTSYFALDFRPSDAIDVVTDATALPIRSQCADLIVCFESLQHIARYNEMLNEAVRVLRPSGNIILSVPFMYCECDVVDFHRWTAAGIAQELEERGFSVLRIQRRGGALYAIINIIIWVIQHIVPGSRVTWRSSRSVGAYCREAILNLFTLPFTLLCWPAFILDNFLPMSGFYAGTYIFARLGNPPARLKAMERGSRTHMQVYETARVASSS
jgi:SAM-dependent methyltransferase